jgi:hypothetical protein
VHSTPNVGSKYSHLSKSHPHRRSHSTLAQRGAQPGQAPVETRSRAPPVHAMSAPALAVKATSRHPKSAERYKLSGSLWASSDVVAWRAHADAYPRVARSVTGGRVVYGKGEWVDAEACLCDLQGEVMGRSPKYLTRADLLVMTGWKMSRNQARMNYAMTADGANSDEKVRRVSEEAFRLWESGEWEQAMVVMSRALRGVGAATASVVMSLVDSGLPFYGEEAARAASGGGEIGYRQSDYEAFTVAMQRRADEINAVFESRDMEGSKLSAVQVEQALFSVAHVDFVRGAGLLQDEEKRGEGGSKVEIAGEEVTRAASKGGNRKQGVKGRRMPPDAVKDTEAGAGPAKRVRKK